MSSASLLAVFCLWTSDVTGVWKGSVEGEGYAPVPLPATLWLETGGGEQVAGQIRLQGFGEPEVTGTFDAVSGRLELEGAFGTGTLRVVADLEAESLIGAVLEVTPSLQLRLERVARERLEAPTSPGSPRDLGRLSPDQWMEDLAFLGEYLPQVHAAPFHSLSRRSWDRALGDLTDRILGGELGSAQAVVALAQLVARVGDAHTELNWREALPGGAFDIAFVRLSDGLFAMHVTGPRGDVRYRGARVLRIGALAAPEAEALVSTLFAAENDAWRGHKASGLLLQRHLLWTLDVIEDPRRLPLELELPDGERIEMAVGPASGGSMVAAELPLWLTRRHERYWFEVLPEAGAVYFAYNRCAEDEQRPMEGFVEELLAAVDEANADRLVIDLRHNSGGNSAVLSTHMERLFAHPRLRAGKVVALTGANTYSSGMMNAHQLRGFGAVLVGEPTGGKPNSYGELRSFRLPNSGLQVFYSTKYFPMIADGDPASVEPDELVETTGADYFGERDPVLDRALEL